MSSPSNVVIVVDIPGAPHDRCASVARKQFAEWQEANPRTQYDSDYRYFHYWHTDAVIEAFFERVISGQAYSDGNQGTMLCFAFCGNYVGSEDLLAVLVAFVRGLDEDDGGQEDGGTCATLMLQHTDSSAFTWKVDGSSGYEPVGLGTTGFSFEREFGEADVWPLPQRNKAIAVLRELDVAERRKVFAEFCTGCGGSKPHCHCPITGASDEHA